MDKRNKFLIVYFLIIAIALVSILFIIPDSVFREKYDNNAAILEHTSGKAPVEKEFKDYELQKNNLMNNSYKYEYTLLDSMSNESYIYKCTGTKEDNLETGTCTEPEKISYTEKDKKDVLSKINYTIIEPDYLFSFIKEIEPKKMEYGNYRDYTYNTKLNKLDTEIIIKTDKDNITEINISNAYMTYILKYRI